MGRAKRERADRLLVARDLAEDGTRAQALILAGRVFSGETRVDKAGQLLEPDAPLEFRGRDHTWVGPGGLKLAPGRGPFALHPAGPARLGGFGRLLMAGLYRSLNWVMLKESVYLTAKATAIVCWLCVGSWTFASVFSYLGGHEIIEHFVLGFELKPWQFLVMVQFIIFILGWPLEWSEILIIFVPIFLPMLPAFDVNPYFFAMLVALNLQTSFLTPPMAMSAYYLKGVLGKAIELADIFKGIIPYLFIVIFIMVMMYQFPGIALWLPDFFFGKYIP